jgi:hypothetical protein
MSFTKEQRAVVESTGAVPMTIDGIPCVVLRADVFEEACGALPDGLTHDELRALLAASVQGSDWLSPEMDIYDRYDEHR